MPDLRATIATALAAFTTIPLKAAANGLLAALGYQSDKSIHLGNSTPNAFLDFLRSHAKDAAFDETKALFPDWKSADLLFQFTDDELTTTASLFPDTVPRYFQWVAKGFRALGLRVRGTRQTMPS